ncbi:MAG: hypothetical protein ACREP9_22960 [Candidatus Dormibacteraceae bacterium]
MKTSSVALLVAVWSAAASGQGTVNFCNLNSGAGLNAPMFGEDGVTKLTGPGFTAELVAGNNAGLLSLVAQTRFLTGGGAGYFQGGVATLPMVPPGDIAFLQVHVFATACGTFASAQANNVNGTWGMSSIFSVVTGGAGTPPSLPAALSGLTSFSLALIPEPSALSLSALGLGLGLLLRAKKSR